MLFKLLDAGFPRRRKASYIYVRNALLDPIELTLVEINCGGD